MQENIQSQENIVYHEPTSDEMFEAKQRAQLELMQAFGGEEVAMTWVEQYSARVNELMNDPELNLVARLNDPTQHDIAIEYLKQKLYN